ncbi:alpha/beta fold hydrolase [Aquisalinus flavus]|uniref:AB hydrolase-1 domain-containing protein n=1 Tax=Aquisalinus flavus TaxID=1526572 RepID=A0A8J2V0V5_9PROT|nr:alpha/beta fold hydrolase [Aquisalinus flavus]MBD0426693.1 alpha/beta fold hydrolase [Aquisalinus flavus]UNE46563.1 alpha/beta fold hydrolase [Aquisalinus flavus]GGC95214.1 hypothetical protein GCM10011342_00040 [Aquisalinus flavus]
MGEPRYRRPVSVLRTLLAGAAFALVVSLPFLWLHEEAVTAPVVFPGEAIAAGTVAAVDCPFRHRRDPGVTCYRAYVPQDHDDPASRPISIFATVIEPLGGATKADPFLYLEGGPGYASVFRGWEDYGPSGNARWFFGRVLDSGRAVVLVDTRGLGLAQPALDCPGLDKAQWEELKRPPAQRSTARERTAMQACLEALTDKGVALDSYHSGQLGRDLKILREGLGLNQWNAYGVSYGAQSLLALLEADRDGVRTATFDSPSYGRLDFLPGDQAAFDRAVEMVAAFCEERRSELYQDLDDSPEIAISYMDETSNDPCTGNTLARLEQVLIQLDERPLTLRNQPFANPVYLTSREAISLFHEKLYSGDGWKDFAYMLSHFQQARSGYFASLSQNNIDWYNSLSWSYHDDTFSFPVYLATTCTESDTRTPARGSPWPLMTAEDAALQRDGCAMAGTDWDGRRFDASDHAGVPSLVVSGWRDVITPPAYGEQLAADIGGHFVLNNEEAHGVVFWAWQECELDMMVAFMDDPAAGIDAGLCLDRCREQAGPVRDEAAAGDRVFCRDIADNDALSQMMMYLQAEDYPGSVPQGLLP